MEDMVKGFAHSEPRDCDFTTLKSGFVMFIIDVDNLNCS